MSRSSPEALPHTGNWLVDALPRTERVAITQSADRVPLGVGDILGRPGDAIERVYFPTAGVVSALAVLADGRSVETAMIGRDGGVGLVPGAGSGRSRALLKVQIAGEALAISLKSFQTLAGHSAAMRAAILEHADNMHQQTVQAAACNALCSAETRIARWLLMCRERIDEDVIPLRQDELALTLGLQRTTVTAAARALQGRGLIEYSRGRIQILNPAGLVDATDGCYQPAGQGRV